ncbi:hypothetical protein LUX05_13770 [Streptomyces somaliensis]|nr:hypothetical protein [Streptomyces somaliensis]
MRAAEEEFAAVYAALPGEWAPKLALGYCAEYLSADAERTRDYYEAVWQRDRTQGSAAFGLVRAHLRDGDRRGAVAVLDAVPTTSRHHDAARVAAVRVLGRPAAGRAPGSGRGPRTHRAGAAGGRRAARGTGRRGRRPRDPGPARRRGAGERARLPGRPADGDPTSRRARCSARRTTCPP